MSTDRRYEKVVSTVVIAIFAACFVITVATNEPPEFTEQYVQLAIAWVLLTTPWVIAVRLLWRAWWAQNAANLSTMDGPARLLAAAAVTLPDDRRDWGAAMAAELDQVQGSSVRWRFAAGCARAAIFPPRSNRVPVFVVAALAVVAAVTAQSVVGYALPAMRIFAITFIALVGALTTLAVARSRRVRQSAPGPTITAAGLTGVGACIGATAYFLVKHPAAAEHFPPVDAVVLAVALAGCLWLALTPPRGLATGHIAHGFGAAAALALGLGFFISSRLTINTEAGPFVWVLLAPPVIFFAGSALASALGRSFRAGVQAAVWTALVGTLLIFAISIPEAMHRYEIDGRVLGDGEMGFPVGVNLSDAIWVLFVIPVWGLPFGVIGAAIGRRLRGPSQSTPTLPERRPY
jgi:hypothetical protein